MIYSFCRCDTCPGAWYLMRKKTKGLERVCELLLGPQAKPPKQLCSSKVRFGSKLLKNLLRSA